MAGELLMIRTFAWSKPYSRNISILMYLSQDMSSVQVEFIIHPINLSYPILLVISKIYLSLLLLRYLDFMITPKLLLLKIKPFPFSSLSCQSSPEWVTPQAKIENRWSLSWQRVFNLELQKYSTFRKSWKDTLLITMNQWILSWFNS